ncbi:hypothetical protein Tco_1171366 [Tanacetum coccineum]
MGDTIAQTRFENVSQLSNDPLLARDKEDLGEDASKQGRRIHDIDDDEDITLVNDDNKIFDVDALAGEEVFVAEQSGNVVEKVVAVIDAASTIPISAATITDVEITLAQALAELKSAKPKVDKVVIQEPKQGITTTTPTTIIPVPKPPQDKGKGIMIEEPVVEQVKPMKRLEQMRLDEELAFKLQAEEEERLAREKAQQIEEANIAWDDVQAKVKADYQLAQRLQAQEQEELTDEENASWWKRVPRRHKQSWKRILKKSEAEVMESSSKRADNDQEAAKIKELMEIVPDKEEVAIDVISLAVKPPSIVDWKIHKEGKKTYYQIIMADGSSKIYLVFTHMLKSFDMEDLETLWKLVKTKHGSTRPEEGYERVLWGDLKVMFEPHVEDTVWRNQQDYKVLEWKLYDSCGVHFLRMQHI